MWMGGPAWAEKHSQERQGTATQPCSPFLSGNEIVRRSCMWSQYVIMQIDSGVLSLEKCLYFKNGLLP